MATSKSDDFATSSKLQDKGNGLLLYLNNYSFYAQKVSSPNLYYRPIVLQYKYVIIIV